MSLQDQIQSLLDQLTASGKERGVQFAAYVNGKLIVDAFSGVADAQTKEPVTADTLFPVFSVSKGIAATVVHQVVEKSGTSYDMPIAKVWPEFAANGKERITLRQGLNHSAGLPFMPNGIGFPEMCDWHYMCRAIAKLTPAWKPGTRMEYHAMTFGWIVGEVARRVAGSDSFERLLEENVCRPLGINGLYIGMPNSVKTTVATLEQVPVDMPPATVTGPEAIPSWMGPLYAIMNRADLRHACLPASSGIMTARALAKHYAGLLPGGVDGVELLPPHRIKLASEPQRPDEPEGEYPTDWGLGYKVGVQNTLSHGGYGGASAFGNPETRTAVGFTKNLFASQDSLTQILAILQKPEVSENRRRYRTFPH